MPGKKRVVKDVLVLGTFKGFQATPDILEAIRDRFYEHKDAGIRHPLTWGHGQIALGVDTDDRDSIDDIDDVWTDGKTLWMSAYVTPEDAAQLKKKRREVSIAVAHDWVDPMKRKWAGPSLMHVAVVTHASVPGQEPFVELAAEVATKPMTFDVAVEAINKLAKHAGFPGLPESVNEGNFNDVVPAIVDAWTGQTKKEDPMAEAANKTEEAAKKPEPVTMGADIEAKKVEALSAEVVALQTKLKAMEDEKAEKAKSDFEAQVETCLKAGMPAAHKATLIQLGNDLKHNATAFATLSAFAAGSKITLGTQIGSVVTPEEPKTGVTPEQKAKALAALGVA